MKETNGTAAKKPVRTGADAFTIGSRTGDVSAQIGEVIAWCKKKKAESDRVFLIEENPFTDFDWARNKTRIEIDRPTSIADKSSLVYDSTTNSLWEYRGGMWARLNP